jgi:UDP-glucuronate decarboxylase
MPTDDPKQRKPDISLAEEAIDWRPTVPLREGLVRTIAYFDKLLSKEAAP